MMDLSKLNNITITLKDGRQSKILSAKLGENSIVASVTYTDKLVSLRICLEKGIFTIDDKELVDEIRITNAEIVENEKRRNEIEKQQKAEQDAIERKQQEEKEKKQKIYEFRQKNPCDNMVFRSQICDGGTEDYSNWFKGICSEKMKNYHIYEDNHDTWCNNCSMCLKVLKGLETADKIQEEYDKSQLCYESKILQEHIIKAGWDTEEVKGKGIKKISKPRTWRLNDDHLAILMTLEVGKDYKDAIIYSIFLTSETTQGNDNTEASTKAKDGYIIDLTIAEARKMKLWEYMPAVGGKNPTFWGSGLYRYVSDEVAARILYDAVQIVKLRNNDDETRQANAFLKAFLDSYGGDIENIPPKQGALIKK